MSASKRILVVNDTKEILELFRDFLETELGHQVTLMSFAPDELDRIADGKPDLIIIDFVIGDR
ncbi:MAG TPA: response regulator, partial [Candidatus Binatia bacterium]|nr:response regulator [Candidatus Binatia bacterium]